MDVSLRNEASKWCENARILYLTEEKKKGQKGWFALREWSFSVIMFLTAWGEDLHLFMILKGLTESLCGAVIRKSLLVQNYPQADAAPAGGVCGGGVWALRTHSGWRALQAKMVRGPGLYLLWVMESSHRKQQEEVDSTERFTTLLFLCLLFHLLISGFTHDPQLSLSLVI